MNHEDVPFIDQEAVRRVSVTVHNDFAYPDNSSRDPLAPQGVDLTYQGDAPRDLPTKVSVTQQPLGVESSSEDVSLVDHSRNDPAVHELAAQGVLTPLRDVPPLTHSHLGSIHNPSKTFSSSPPEVAARRMLFHSDNQRSNSIDGTTTSTSESVTLLVEEVFTAARPQQQSPDDTFSTASSTASEQEFTASTPVKERREAMPIPFSPIRRQDETEVLVRPKVRKASVEGDDDGGALNRERSGTAELSVITTEKETPKDQTQNGTKPVITEQPGSNGRIYFDNEKFVFSDDQDDPDKDTRGKQACCAAVTSSCCVAASFCASFDFCCCELLLICFPL